MSTFAHDITLSVDERWREVELLVELAQNSTSDEALYDALCRSAIVLMIAHFEGFIKACVKAVIEDANKFSNFGKLPNSLKRTYCNKLVQAVDEKKDSKHLNERIKKLIAILDESGAKIEDSQFLVLNEFGNDQNNPKPELLEKICANFGIERFFDRINGSDLDIAFADERTELQNLNQKLLEHLMEGSKTYPYKLDSSSFNITLDGKSTPKQQTPRTIWQVLLDEINRQRHEIAHGTSMSNSSSPEEIINNKNKLRILQYAFILILCENSIPANV